MNGLEAIAFMQQGNMVLELHSNFIYKIMDNAVYFKELSEDKSQWAIDKHFDFSTTYEEYVKSKALTGWERLDKDKEEKFTIITPKGCIELWEVNDKDCNDMYNRANYFSAKEKAEEIDFKQTLFRKLQRFSDENGGTEIRWDGDWSEEHNCKPKYYIFYNHRFNELIVECTRKVQDFGRVHFCSREIAEKAVELFHDDLIKYFTGKSENSSSVDYSGEES